MRISANLLASLAAASTLLGLVQTHAGTFKHITIDGSFDDWAGVPVAWTDAEDASGSFDFRDICVANDEDFLYVRVTLYAAQDIALFNHHLFIDRDNDPSTGWPWPGVGAELFIENGSAYQQDTGVWVVDGGGVNADWAMAPSGQTAQFEARLSRHVLDATRQPIFTQDTIALAVQVLDSNWAAKDDAPGGPGIVYDFAAKPPVYSGTELLLNLTTALWRFDDSGADLGTDWLAVNYDDSAWPTGTGLFGYGSAPGNWPAPISTTLAPTPTTSYFRAPFPWPFDTTGAALLASLYVSDGAILRLNGIEAKRLRLPAGTVTPATMATGGPAAPGSAEVIHLPLAALVTGDNVIQVEVHQSATTPADLAFGLSLTATDSLPPSIEDPSLPADRTVVEGNPTTFDVGTIVGTPPFACQWFKNGTAIAGATEATFTIASVLVTDAGTYSLTITDSKSQQTRSRDAVLSTTALPVTSTDPAQPADQVITEGTPLSLTFNVTGSPVIRYQWSHDDQPLAEATEPTLLIASATTADAGLYQVTAANRVNTLTSRQAQVTVRKDTQGPELAAAAGSARKVVVTFSEPVDPVTAATPALYSIEGGVTVSGAVADPADPSLVTLTTSQQTFGKAYVLTVTGVKDRFGNAARTVLTFRSAIVIDGDLDDWAGIEPLTTLPQDSAEGFEFKDLFVANDDNYLYLRFTSYAPLGPLGVDHYYHILVDADGDPATGRAVAGAGIEVMIENGGGYQQKNGGFNEGDVSGLDLALAPEAASADFECRLSRQAHYDSDGLPVFTGDTVNLVLELISSSWNLLDQAPSSGLSYAFAALEPLKPGPLHTRWVDGKLEITWTGGGVLEFRASLPGTDWTALATATSPYLTEVPNAACFYRVNR